MVESDSSGPGRDGNVVSERKQAVRCSCGGQFGVQGIHHCTTKPCWYRVGKMRVDLALPTEPDDNAWRYVRCPKCGTVAHQPIAEDERHCPCWEIFDDEYGVGFRDDCPCPCHGGGE